MEINLELARKDESKMIGLFPIHVCDYGTNDNANYNKV